MAVILCTGSDAVLMKTRQLLLEHAGHMVVPAYSEKDVEGACSQHVFDVAVIGQSMSPNLKKENVELIRALCPKAKIVELYTPFGTTAVTNADAWLEMPPETPELFVELVNRIASKRAAGG